VQQVSFVGNTFRNDNSYTLTAVLDMDLNKCMIANNVFDGFSTVLEGTYTIDATTRVSGNIGLDLWLPGAVETDPEIDGAVYSASGTLTVSDGPA
jgi:hypothetical protein